MGQAWDCMGACKVRHLLPHLECQETETQRVDEDMPVGILEAQGCHTFSLSERCSDLRGCYHPAVPRLQEFVQGAQIHNQYNSPQVHFGHGKETGQEYFPSGQLHDALILHLLEVRENRW